MGRARTLTLSNQLCVEELVGGREGIGGNVSQGSRRLRVVTLRVAMLMLQPRPQQEI